MKRKLAEEVESGGGRSRNEKKVRVEDQQQLIRPSEVPEYLRDTEFYRSLDTEDDEPFHIPAGHMKANMKVETLGGMCDLLKTARFWGLNQDTIRSPVIQFAQSQPFKAIGTELHKFEEEFDLVKLLLKLANTENCISQRMEAGMELGAIELVHKLNRSGKVEFTDKAISLAASRGHLECLQYALKRRTHQPTYRFKRNIPERVCETAVINGQIECVKTLFRSIIFIRRVRVYSVSKLAQAAARHGQLECLQYLHEQQRYPLHLCATLAAGSGSLDCLKYIIESRQSQVVAGNFCSDVCDAAAECGHVHCLRYLHEQGCPWDYNVGITAASVGSLPCLQYFHEKGGEWHYFVVHAAALHGHLPCLQYAHEHGCPSMPVSTIPKLSTAYQDIFSVSLDETHLVELTARKKHWGCVLYLILQNFPLTRGLTAHLARGHKHSLLQLAVEHGCALANEVGVSYARAGNLEGLHYALQHGSDPSEQILCAAARGGHLECLQYAREHDCPWGSQVRAVAAQKKHLHILEYIDQMCPVVDSPWMLRTRKVQA